MSVDPSPEQESISTVLRELQEVRSVLVELRADVTKATQHFGDVDALQIDVEKIKADIVRLEAKLDALVNGPPALEERLGRLEVKQAADHAEDSEGVAEAGTADDTEHRASSRKQAGDLVSASEARQEEINVEFRAGLGRVERAIFDILHADLKKSGSIILGVVGIVYVLSRVAF